MELADLVDAINQAYSPEISGAGYIEHNLQDTKKAVAGAAHPLAEAIMFLARDVFTEHSGTDAPTVLTGSEASDCLEAMAFHLHAWSVVLGACSKALEKHAEQYK